MTEISHLGDNVIRSLDNAAASTHKAFDNAVDKTGAAVHPAVDHLVAGVHDAVERLASVASQAAGKLELTGDQIKAAQSRMVSSCRGYIREKPLTSLGIAVASGFLISLALRQR